MRSIHCPLCGNANVKVCETLNTNGIRRQYRQQFGIRVHFLEGVVQFCECATCGLRFYDPSTTGGAEFYAQLQDYPWYYLNDKDEYEIARKFVLRSNHVLEVGSGTGNFGMRLDCTSYIGLEFNPNAIKIAKERGLTLLDQQINEHAATHQECYEVVCAFQVLEHLGDPRDFFESAVACLRPGGKLIISVPSENAFLGCEVNNILNMPPHHVTRWTDECLRSVADLFKLRVVSLCHERLSDVHIVPYARCLVQNGIREIVGRKRVSLDRLFSFFPVKIIVWLLSLLIVRALRVAELRPWGHSVTIVYEKSDN